MARHRALGLWGVALLGLSIQLAAAGARADNGVGAWSAPAAWPLMPIHAVITSDARVLTYGSLPSGQQSGIFSYDIWDPTAGLGGGHLTLPNTTGTDMFCSAQMVLPGSGDVFLAGGDLWTGTRTQNRGNRNTLLLSRTSATLARGPDMNRPRWYASITTFVNGEMLILGGRDGTDRPEVRSTSGGLRLLSGADTNGLSWWYPRLFLAPDGRAFGIADTQMFYVEPSGTGLLSGIGAHGGGTGGVTSSEAMFAPGRILRVGGGPGANGTGGTILGSTAASIIDINGPVPVVTPTAPMPAGLHWHVATLGADGRVYVTGGARGNNTLSAVNAHALIWNPATGTWTRGAATSSGKARLYHSNAILLPDASILVGGGGSPGPQTNVDAEIYYPPYLLAADGSFLPRPEVTAAPARAAPGETFTLGVSDPNAVARVTLVKAGSVTHGTNMDQRFVELAFTRDSGSLSVRMPSRPTTAPPGLYMLFVLDGDGVPSVARMLMVDPAQSTTGVAVNWTPTLGSSRSGTAFQLACPSGRVLVGIWGNADSKLRRIGPRCVAINGATGAWTGSVTNGSAAGPATGGAFTRTCPSGQAVSGLRGRSWSDVDRVELECRRVAGNGTLSGSYTYVSGVGGSGGSWRPAMRCGTALAGRGLYGKSSAAGTIQSLGVLCGAPAASLPVRVTSF